MTDKSAPAKWGMESGTGKSAPPPLLSKTAAPARPARRRPLSAAPASWSREAWREEALTSRSSCEVLPPEVFRSLEARYTACSRNRRAEGSWEDIKEEFADRCLAEIARYAPNVPDSVLHRQILTPVDIERIFGLTGGNIFQGSMSLNQLGAMRPVPGWSDHRTPITGLYICGSAAHPGGGVMGSCGRNAAIEMLKDGK